MLVHIFQCTSLFTDELHFTYESLTEEAVLRGRLEQRRVRRPRGVHQPRLGLSQ